MLYFLILQVSATIIIENQGQNQDLYIDSTESTFGSNINSYFGYLYIPDSSIDLTGCQVMKNYIMPDSICLFQRGNCTFSEKVYNGQLSGCYSVIVFDNITEPLISMTAENTEIVIPSTFISLSDGIFLIENGYNGFYLTIIYTNNVNLSLYMILAISGIIIVSLITLCYFTIYYINRRQRIRLARARQIQFMRQENETLPLLQNYKRKINYKENQKYNSCVICISDFICNEELSELKCKHVFHDNCINPWINKNGNCPLCKTDYTI